MIEKHQREFESLYTTPYWGSTYGNGPEEYADNFYPYPAFPLIPPAFINQQKRGEALPYYLNWHQLRTIRDRSRLLCSTNEFTISAYTNLQAFIIGAGFTYRALPAHDDKEPNDELLKRVQRVIDIFTGANRLSQIEAETVYRDTRDGETFLRLFYQPSGLLQVRFVEPEHIYPPEGDGDPKNSFGIESDPRDIATVRGYHVVEEPTAGWTTTFVKAREMIHSKCNTDSGAKRGLPLFYPVEANLRRAEELLAAMSSTAKARAKIALIRHLEGVSKTAAERLKTDLETGSTLDPTTGGVTNVEELKYGTVLTSSKNIAYEFPQAGQGVESTVSILQAELRSIAARLVMPEAMLTADASNGTYSSQISTEAYWTRNFERLQRYYRNIFGESRAPGHESLIWRQIAHAVRTGLLDERALSDVKIVAQAQSIIPRDPDKSAAANKTYFDLSVKSPQGICAELGYDWNAVQRERKAAGLPDVATTLQTQMGMTGQLAPGMDQTAGGEPEPGDEESGDISHDFPAEMFQDL